jgi:hypothetical protein
MYTWQAATDDVGEGWLHAEHHSDNHEPAKQEGNLKVRYHPNNAQKEHDLVAGVFTAIPKCDHTGQIETLQF